MVIAYHLIWTAYGYWLPNDPRGSHSRAVRNDVIAELGELHYGRKRVQPAGRVVQQFREQAADVLKHPLLVFDHDARQETAAAFEEVIVGQQYTCYACAIMPDHVHILIRKHKHRAEEMMQALKDASRLRLIGAGHRHVDHPVWTSGTGWKVFLDTPEDVRRTICYIERNPLPLRLPVQRWSFVRPYDNWPQHKHKLTR
jgi:REP element-mobilizing transposase RayT